MVSLRIGSEEDVADRSGISFGGFLFRVDFAVFDFIDEFEALKMVIIKYRESSKENRDIKSVKRE